MGVSVQTNSTKKLFPANYKLPNVSQLTVEQKIAQILGLVVLPCMPKDRDERISLETFISHYGVGHIHLGYGDLQQVFNCIYSLQKLALDKTGIPIFFGADCEYGIPYNFGFGTELTWQMGITATQNLDNAYQAGVITGKEARAAGLDVVYGPVADVMTNPKNSIITIRSFGSDPEVVSQYVANYVRGCQEQGVIATLKHFPGHGQVTEDSHRTLPVDTSDMAFIEKYHLPPFIAGIQAGAKAIMTSHIVFPCMDNNLPATVSPAIMTGLLRKKLGFQGLVITDNMAMNAISQCLTQTQEEYAIEAIKAGCDIVLSPGRYENLIDMFKRALDSGYLSEQALDLSVSHVLSAKQWVLPYHLNPDEHITEVFFQDQHRAEIAEQMAKDSITLMPGYTFEKLPDVTSYNIISVLDSSVYYYDNPEFVTTILQRYPKSVVYKITENISNAKLSSIKEQLIAVKCPTIIAIFCNLLWFNGLTYLSDRLIENCEWLAEDYGIHATILFGSPYMLKHLPGKIKFCAYGASAAVQKACALAILGEIPISGKLPVVWEEHTEI